MQDSRRISVGLSALICLFALLVPGPVRAQSEALTRNYQRGSSLFEAGMYKAATPYFVKALALSESEYGRESTRTAFVLKNLATVYARQGMYTEAVPLYTRALGIFENTFGPDHGIVAEVVNELSITYIEQKRYIEAEPLLARVLDSLKRAYGADDPRVAVAAYNYGYASEYLGDGNKARKLYARALEIWQSQPAPDEKQIRAVKRRLDGLKRVRTSQGPSLAPYLPRVLPGSTPQHSKAPAPATLPQLAEKAKGSPVKRATPLKAQPQAATPHPMETRPAKPTAQDVLPASAAESAGWRVQLASFRARAAAEKESARLQTALTSVLAKGGGLKIAEAALPKGTFYRIFAGPFADRREAAALCRDLKAEQQDCLVVRQD